MIPKRLGSNVRIVDLLPRYMGVTDACRYTGLSEKSMKGAIERGEIEEFMIEGKRLILRKSVDQWIRRGKVRRPVVDTPKRKEPRVRARVIAKYYDTSEGAVMKWAARGVIPSIRIGEKTLRFDLDAVIEAVEGKPRPKDH